MMHSALNHGFLAADDRIEDVDLVAAIRELNSTELEVPWMWSIDYDTEGVADPNGISLLVGVRGDVGALCWATNSGDTLVPADGTNDEEVMYRLAGLHESYMPIGAEVPVEKVYAALSEFLVTHKLPKCIEWRSAPK